MGFWERGILSPLQTGVTLCEMSVVQREIWGAPRGCRLLECASLRDGPCAGPCDTEETVAGR